MVQSTAFLLSNQGFLVFHFQFSFEKIYLYQTPKKSIYYSYVENFDELEEHASSW